MKRSAAILVLIIQKVFTILKTDKEKNNQSINSFLVSEKDKKTGLKIYWLLKMKITSIDKGGI